MVNRAIPLRLLAMPVPRLAKSAISMLLHGLIERQKTKNDMTASLKAIDGNGDLPALMNELAAGARAASRVLSLAPPEQKNRALKAMERAIHADAAAILAANGFSPVPGAWKTAISTLLFTTAATKIELGPVAGKCTGGA